jgi:DNA-binding transcriptional regulator YiaG
MENISVMLSAEQSASLQKYVFELTKSAIAEARNVAGIDKPFLKQQPMADYLGVSVNTIKKFEKMGMKSVTIDGLKLYSKDEATKFLLLHQK